MWVLSGQCSGTRWASSGKREQRLRGLRLNLGTLSTSVGLGYGRLGGLGSSRGVGVGGLEGGVCEVGRVC